MKILRLMLSLALFVPGFAFLGACAACDNRERTPWLAGSTRALIGVFFGLVFGGVRGRWLDAIFPPTDPDEAAHPHLEPTWPGAPTPDLIVPPN